MIIYKVKNRINNKCYIGKTCRSIDKRKVEHYRSKGNLYFHNALKKYGKKNFEWKIVEECNSNEDLNLAEEWYIRYYNSYVPNGYNLTYGGEGQSKGYSPSLETRKKISIGNKNKKRSKETKKKLSISKMGEKNPMYGKKHTKKSKRKMGLKLDDHPNYGKHLSEKTKSKISQSLKGHLLTEKTKSKISQSLKGRKFSKETIEKFKTINTGKNNSMYGHVYTKEELEKRSTKKWILYNKDGRKETIKVMSIWCKKNNIPISTIRRTLKTGKYCRSGWMIKTYE